MFASNGLLRRLSSGSLWESQETHAIIPAVHVEQPTYQPTTSVEVPRDPGHSWCMILNTAIWSFHARVIFEYMDQWWEVKKVAVHNDRLYCVTYLDHEGKEHKAFVLRKINFFKIFEG